MTDRELLELAAKAAGIEAKPHPNHRLSKELVFMVNARNWNPLTDDGDALRLAVKLGLTICNDHESSGSVVCTRTDADDFPAVLSGKPGDPPGITPEDYAATRRAIVRAAAAIGETL